MLLVVAAIGLVALGAPMKSMLTDMFPHKERGKVFGILRMTSTLAVIASIFFFGHLAEILNSDWEMLTAFIRTRISSSI
jgi:MFS-type transporter involved in bile tolerance (Atg22 family)